jgi:hypothetical protein
MLFNRRLACMHSGTAPVPAAAIHRLCMQSPSTNRRRSSMSSAEPVRRDPGRGFSVLEPRCVARRFLTQKLRLTVNEAKSAVARPEERKFLGFSISNDGSERRIAPKAYFGFCQTPRVLTNLEAWIRRRLRSYLWRQWQNARRKRSSAGADHTLPGSAVGPPPVSRSHKRCHPKNRDDPGKYEMGIRYSRTAPRPHGSRHPPRS